MQYAAIGAAAAGLMLLWVAAWFTIITGFDYFRNALPHIKAGEGRFAEPLVKPED
jgi:phosphatidylglycerophosphate synthase